MLLYQFTMRVRLLEVIRFIKWFLNELDIATIRINWPTLLRTNDYVIYQHKKTSERRTFVRYGKGPREGSGRIAVRPKSGIDPERWERKVFAPYIETLPDGWRWF